jgi:hypothetical protein
MPEAGLEPARPEGRGILSPLRLPIPPLGRETQSSRSPRSAQRKCARTGISLRRGRASTIRGRLLLDLAHALL